MTPEELKHELNMIALTCKPVVENEDAWQKHATPDSIVEQMLDMYYNDRKFNNSKKILVLFNVEFIKGLYDRFKDEVRFSNIYFVADCQEKFDAIKNEYPEIKSVFCNYHDVNYLVDKIGEFKVKKFDVVFSNPPYDRNLHLKILKVIRSFSNEQIFIHPDDWLKNPFRDFEKEKIKYNAVKEFGSFIKKYYSITPNSFNEIFGTANFFGVGIFYYVSQKTNFDIDQFLSNDKTLLKILNATHHLPSFRSFYKCKKDWENSGNVVLMRRTTHGYLEWFDDISNNKITQGIEFSNKNIAENFKNSISTEKTWFYDYLNKCAWIDGQNSGAVPCFMNERRIENGKEIIGYEKVWTNEDYIKFCKLDKNDLKNIEEVINQ